MTVDEWIEVNHWYLNVKFRKQCHCSASGTIGLFTVEVIPGIAIGHTDEKI